jgi:hypothetical protein
MLLFLGLMVGAMAAGQALRARLPDHHRSSESQEAVVRAVGVVVTLTALVLGLVVTTAEQYYQSVESELTEIAANALATDAVLARYGPGSATARTLLRDSIDAAVASVWPGHGAGRPATAGTGMDVVGRLADVIEALPRADGRQAEMQQRAAVLVGDMELAGFKLERLQNGGAQPVLMGVLLSWLAIAYLGLGLVLPRTSAATLTTILSAMACSGALFLVVEFYSPVSGLVQIGPSILEGALPR